MKCADQNPCRFFTNRAEACPCPLYAGTTPLSTDLEALKLPAVCSDYPLDGNNGKGAGTIEQKDGESSRLVLGFGAGCMTCSEVVKRVEEQVGERLEVRDLRDPDVTRWIKDVLDNWNRPVSRRGFLGAGGLGVAALILGRTDALAFPRSKSGYGHPRPDPGGLIYLPRGIQYRIVSEVGSTLSTGVLVPGDHDGIAAFPGPGKTTVLVRNHELGYMDRTEGSLVGQNPYDREERGGTTGIVVGPDHREISSFVISSGTRNNCTGGATPWGTWLTCEEDRTTDHGYIFEVDPREPENDLSKTPIRGMGFFFHEAVGIDSATSIAYLTEDDFRGAVTTNSEDERPGASRTSFLYRYRPNTHPVKPGDLHKGDRLQVLALEEKSRYNADFAVPAQRFGVVFGMVWKDVDPEDPHADARYKDAARFNRLEGAHFAGGHSGSTTP